MTAAHYLLAGAVALGTGLDRTAALQSMISRPIVAAPLTGWMLGDAAVGLQIGLLVELLWLGRLPVGAAIPPDDTQVAVGSTVLVLSLADRVALNGLPLLLLCVLVAMPLGKVGQLFDRLARHRNGRLLGLAETALAAGDLTAAERCHLRGVQHFALAALASFAVIVGFGSAAVCLLAPLLSGPLLPAAAWIVLALPLAGAATILATSNIRRVQSLFGASFAAVLLALWLV